MTLLALAHSLGGQGFVSQVSKRGTTAGSVLEIPVGARALAMGNAQVATISDGSAFYWNPAMPARQTQLRLHTMYMPWLADTYYSHLAVSFPVPGRMVMGAQVTTWGMDDMIVRTEQLQQGTGEQFDAGDLVIGISLARALTDKYAIGFTAKFIQERIWHSTARAVALDFGTLFRANIGHGVNIAAVIANYGSDMRLSGRDIGHVFDPDPTIQGNNSEIPSQYDLDAWPLPLYFRFGLATDIVRTGQYRITTEIDALHPSNNYPSLDAGVELAFRDFASLRAGYSGLFLEDSVEGFSLGAGVKLTLPNRSLLSFDYGFRNFGPFGYLQALSVDVAL